MTRSGAGAAATGRDHLPSLTGLRFWAALLVVLYHLSRQAGTLPWISDAAWYGRSGVTFFFVLSGFVLAWTYDGKRVPYRVFVWRRFARIWPLLALSVVASVGVWVWMDRPVSAAAVVATLLAVNAWVPDPVMSAGGNPAAWSLSDEAWFYLIFPALLVLLARGRAGVWAAVAVAVTLGSFALWVGTGLAPLDPQIRGWSLDYFPLTRTLQFVLGVVAGLAVKRGRRIPVPLWVAGLLVVGWHLALVPWHEAVPDSLWYGPYTASQLLSAPLFAALICAAAQADLRGRRTGLGGPWMIRLGHWSFAWYLFHEIVLRAVVFVDGKPRPGAETLSVWLFVAVASLLVAGVCYEAVERPAERWLRRVGPALPAPRERERAERVPLGK
ncbi:acyltransferase family protein [Streptomyces sp. NPDC055078]